MAMYRNALPQLDGDMFLTDGGLETTLIYNVGIELPEFAAFDLLSRPSGEATLRIYYHTYADVAERFGAGLILESATWRSNPDWGARLGYDRKALAQVNTKAIQMLLDVRAQRQVGGQPIVVSGCLGPRGDGYVPDQAMSVVEARAYHAEQVRTFALAGADMVAAITMNYVEEAIGIALAARDAEMPIAISFTVETDGRLPTGESLVEAIDRVDQATGDYPAYYMINCAHPTHFEHVLREEHPALRRIRGVRANASCRSHSELNEATELDAGNPSELGSHYAELKRLLPSLNVLGGCCGTDERHVEQIAEACAPLFEVAELV
jgi:S-methylmethionine-dependent homocysteine/selenocysteine methylase